MHPQQEEFLCRREANKMETEKIMNQCAAAKRFVQYPKTLHRIANKLRATPGVSCDDWQDLKCVAMSMEVDIAELAVHE